MTIHVVTGLHADIMHLYGRRFLETFDKHWPADFRLTVYYDGPRPTVERGFSLIDGPEMIPEMRAFQDRWRDSLLVRGASVDLPRVWHKPKERAAGYNFRFDAWKFSKQIFFMTYHGLAIADPGDVVIWLDGDVVTFADVPETMVDDLVPGDAAVTFLGRGAKHSEIGFLAFRLPLAGGLLSTMMNAYASGTFESIVEWHSAYIFDWARRKQETIGLKTHDLTPDGRGHVWFQSPLCQWTDHLKGDRKKAGISRERRK